MKHTQGEWMFGNWVKMKGQGDIPTEIIGSGKPFGRKIAELNFDINDQELSSDKVIANAKLIAAAPDLLACILALQELANREDEPSEDQFNVVDEMVQNAILKATS